MLCVYACAVELNVYSDHNLTGNGTNSKINKQSNPQSSNLKQTSYSLETPYLVNVVLFLVVFVYKNRIQHNITQLKQQQ